jgi:hypothetical protein
MDAVKVGGMPFIPVSKSGDGKDCDVSQGSSQATLDKLLATQGKEGASSRL